MSFIKRQFSKPKTSWIIFDIDEDGVISKQSYNGKRKLLSCPRHDGPRDFELVLTDANKIVMRWTSSKNSEYQIEVDASGINRSLFDNTEPFNVSGKFQKLLPKEDFFWYKSKNNGDGAVTYEREAIPAEKLDNTYELYRIIFYFCKLCLNCRFDPEKMATTGTFFICFPDYYYSQYVFKRLFFAYLKQNHLLPKDNQWEIVFFDSIEMKKTKDSREITAKEAEGNWDISTALYYNTDELTKMKIRSGLCLGMELQFYDKQGNKKGEPILFHGF
jgi:hypothetical protein